MVGGQFVKCPKIYENKHLDEGNTEAECMEKSF